MNGTRLRPTAGILARVPGLPAALTAVLSLLVVASTVRYVDAHGIGDRAGWVLGGAVLLVITYAAYSFTAASPWRGRIWLGLVVAMWFGLVLMAPSFAWCAVPLCFVALRVLPFTAACVLIAAMVATVIAAWMSMSGRFDPTIVAGPVSVAVLAVAAYRALEREAAVRQALLDELREAEGDLADAQHQAGVQAERARLSRDIHDSVAQGLSSINLLLQAAQQGWTTHPAAARDHVSQAALTARDGLDEVRRVVRDLAPAELEDSAGAGVPAAMRRAAAETAGQAGLDIRVLVSGTPVPVAPAVATALLRTARGALANVVEHAAARTTVITLTYQPDAVVLDVRDDGVGFDPAGLGPARGSYRGRGLDGIRRRVELLGGRLVVESAPGDGAALAVTIPLEPES
ncbi:sensor histidine kinase [Kribbella catacumbae]|uniref:sensor histidine kinase n=1 Tax=Kribbella catacumbae TaxID=460086 RepID=UPI0003730041|nr:sensor histidine kinase [Kribbella catacumbae]